MSVKLTTHDRSFLSSLGISDDYMEQKLDEGPALATGGDIAEIAFGMLREEQAKSKMWKDAAFGWCSWAILSTIGLIAVLIWKL